MLKHKHLIVLIIFFLSAFHLSAQFQGPNDPSNSTIIGQGANMMGISNLYSSGGYTSAVDLAAYPTCIGPILCYHSPLLQIDGFGFSIPSNSIITGIVVEISKKVSQPITTIHDSLVQLSMNGVAVGVIKKSTNQWQMNLTYETYGDSTDLWDTIWTPADINSAAFGVFYQITNGNIDQTAQVDHIRIIVHYTMTTGEEQETQTQAISFYQKDNNLFSDFVTNSGSVQLELIDISGKNVYKINNYTGEAIDISFLEKGIYIIKIISEEKIYPQKITIN